MVAGLGNPSHGDDGIGPLVARAVCAALGSGFDVTLLEWAGSSFDLAERLAGYDRAVILDALVDEDAAPGELRRWEPAPAALPGVSLHTAGLDAGLALARVMGVGVPADVRVYGIVVRDPWVFREGVSPELELGLARIVSEILAAEFAHA